MPGKWRDPKMRYMYKIRKRWYLKHGGMTHKLGTDLVEAIKQAELIRGGQANNLEAVAERLARIAQVDREHAELEADTYVDAYEMQGKHFKNDEQAVKFYKRATGQSVSLYDLAKHDADILSSATLTNRQKAIKRSGIEYLSDVPDKATANRVRDQWFAKGMSRATAVTTLRVLKRLWAIAVERDFVQSSPWTGITIKDVRTEKRPFTVEEVKKVMAKEPDLTLALACTGMRISELLGCSLKGNVVTIKKGKTESAARTLTVPEEVAGAIAAVHSEKMKYRSWHNRVTKVFKKHGFEDVDIHSFRRFTMDRLMVHEVPEHVASAIAGHKHAALAYGRYAAKVRQDVILKVLTDVYKEVVG